METTWKDPNEREYVIFEINGQKVPMLQTDYDAQILIGNKNPVLIGHKIYMVNDNDFEALTNLQNKMESIGLDKLPNKIKKSKRK